MRPQPETFRGDTTNAEKGPSLRHTSDVMHSRDVLQSTLSTTAEPGTKHLAKLSARKEAAQRRSIDKARKREAVEERVLRGLKILKLEWDRLSDTERASRLNKLHFFGSCVVKEKAGAILGLTDEEVRGYTERGRGLRRDEVFLDDKRYHRSERDFKFWS